MNIDLDVATPEGVPDVLRKAAWNYREAHNELQAMWQDKHAGKVWEQFARILEKAAEQCEKELKAEGL